MKYTVKKFGAKQCHERTYENGARIFFSYATPVGAYMPGVGAVRTTYTYSRTTSTHVNMWASEIGVTGTATARELKEFYHICEYEPLWSRA